MTNRLGGSAAAIYTELSGLEELGEPPLVSVIIPVFNRAKLLSEALRSVVDQIFTDWEAIIVDDGSSDESAQVALRLGMPGKVRVLRHDRNYGAAVARNTGILAARGRFVSFLDSDDSWHPDKLNQQVKLIQTDTDPDMVFCVTRTRVFRNGRFVCEMPRRAPFPTEPWSEFLYINGGFAQSSTFFLSRELALKIGFRSCLVPHEDSMFFLESGAHGARYRLIPEALSNWNDDWRADRISAGSALERDYEYLVEAGRLITNRARLAFEVRNIGPTLFRKSPLQAIRLFTKAAKDGAMPPWQLMAVCSRCMLPHPVVRSIKRIFYFIAR